MRTYLVVMLLTIVSLCSAETKTCVQVQAQVDAYNKQLGEFQPIANTWMAEAEQYRAAVISHNNEQCVTHSQDDAHDTECKAYTAEKERLDVWKARLAGQYDELSKKKVYLEGQKAAIEADLKTCTK
jgi:hypothetical protein